MLYVTCCMPMVDLMFYVMSYILSCETHIYTYAQSKQKARKEQHTRNETHKARNETQTQKTPETTEPQDRGT